MNTSLEGEEGADSLRRLSINKYDIIMAGDEKIMDAPPPSNDKKDPTGDIVEAAASGKGIISNIIDDVAETSPKDESLQLPLGISSPSTTTTSADGDISSSPSAKKITLPETPRWRFVSQAKKTEGYSSSAAGRLVIGE